MILHTWHNPEYNILDKPDLSKSIHYTDYGDSMKKAYDWLFKEIGTNSIVWCWPEGHKGYKTDHGITEKQWILDVPDNKIIAYLNSDAWDYIIGDFTPVPEDVYSKWDREYAKMGRKLKKDVSEARDMNIRQWRSIETAFFDMKEKQWLESKNITKEELWKKNLFFKKVMKTKSTQVLIPSPVKKSWIKDCIHYSTYDVDLNKKEYLDRIFDNVDDAIRYINIIKAHLNGRKIKYKTQCEGYPSGSVVVKFDRGWENK